MARLLVRDLIGPTGPLACERGAWTSCCLLVNRWYLLVAP